MNIAMTLYSELYTDSKCPNRLDTLKTAAYPKAVMTQDNALGHMHYIFKDGSRLIFTSDNVQVSLF
ncbi:MAG TPA: hypothetical protein VNU45_18045 [Rummeliibacillus sp.]|nr:hypothetical protein [Rummeliibacillus sp.]